MARSQGKGQASRRRATPRRGEGRARSIFDVALERGPANHVPLTPLSFLVRAAAVYPGKTAVIHGDRRLTYADLQARCRRLASALRRRGIGPGDTVAVMAPNVPALLEAGIVCTAGRARPSVSASPSRSASCAIRRNRRV